MSKHYNETKRGKSSNVLMNILLVIFSCIFLVSAFVLINEKIVKPYKMKSNLSAVQSELSEATLNSSTDTSAEESSSSEKADKNSMSAAIKKLKDKYPNMVGWVKIPNTDVDFPVMQSSTADSQYYLYRNYKGEEDKYGSIFLNAYNHVDSDLQILFGHSMLDKTVFYCLIDFADLDVYKKSPVIEYDTVKAAGSWKIISVFKTNTEASQGEPFDYVISNFGSSDDKKQFIYDCMIRSTIDTGVTVNEDDDLLMLSTCSYEMDGFRTVVVARKTRDGEDSTVDTSLAKQKNDTLYPDAWYSEFGGSKPDLPADFDEALSQNLVSWYDKKE